MSWNRPLKPDQTAEQDLSAAALDFTTDYGRSFSLEAIFIKASTNITETVTITVKSAQGSEYDQTLAKLNIDGADAANWRPSQELDLQAGDEIQVECTNANATGTVYAMIKAKARTQ